MLLSSGHISRLIHAGRFGWSSSPLIPPFGNVEAKGPVCRKSFAVHPLEDGNAYVDVVVEFDVVFAWVRAKKAADILDHSALEGDGEGAKQRVELGPVKALADVRLLMAKTRRGGARNAGNR